LDGEVIELPKPPKISMPVEEAIQRRRSIREYRHPIDLTRFSQLLFYSLSRAGSGYGAPQTALNDVEVYVAVGEGKVEGVPAGIYLYRRDEHTLKMLREGASFKNSLQRRRIGSGLRKPALTSFSSLILSVVCCEKVLLSCLICVLVSWVRRCIWRL